MRSISQKIKFLCLYNGNIDVQKNRVTQLRAGTLNLQGFGNEVAERSTLKIFLVKLFIRTSIERDIFYNCNKINKLI